MSEYNPGRERGQVTAAPNIQTERVRMDPDGEVNSLLKALGSGSVQGELDAFNQQYQAKKLQEQQQKVEWYVEQFRQDHAGGAVSQAQVKERFPETVPVIASRIAEAVGQKEGRKQFDAVVEEILADDNLRLNSEARKAYIEKRRGELVATVGEGNEFYGAGFVSSIDKLIGQHELSWQSETAQYHQQVQTEQFSAGVTEALNSEDPLNALLSLDEKFGRSSSLNNLERNKVVVSTAIDLAFSNDDMDLLKKVPQRFLNTDSKAALEKARVQIQDRRLSNFRQAEFLRETKRARDLRDAKSAIVDAAVNGEPLDPAQFRDNPEAFAYAIQMREAPMVSESSSAATAESIRQTILTAATLGDGEGPDELRDRVLNNRSLNPKEKQALIAEIPKLIEGRNLMKDEDVRQPLTDFLRPALDVLGRSTNSTIQALLAGKNLEMQVTRGYDHDIRMSFRAEYEETGKWPTGHRKHELIRAATDRAEARLEKLTKIGGATDKPAPATPSKPAALPKGVTKID